ncbi:SDR family oxidoreductase [Confluentibacter flavum]|uniref:Short-chain dehydrogenase n=1 Tax=Confluentibacter flavum TaxID=1909700 RepID=A0A2N3HHS2_9FLAO|nr:SDR family oxidoreductase [Confluentibacter flavum]PKQ44432.1 short-chain dehydrogenase [Confluentibacter flavum]
MEESFKVAIITGASSGIGEGVAYELDAIGIRLVLTSRRENRLKVLCDKLKNAVYLAGDIKDEALPSQLVKKALDSYGRFDILFNGAGVMHAGTIEKIDIDLMCEMARVNFEVTIRMAYTALKHFKIANSGFLINVSSILGTKVRPSTGVYAGSKFAIEAFSEAIRMEVAGTNIRVSVIEPGVTISELQDHFEVHPAKLLGIEKSLNPSDIARAVRFILEQPDHVRIPVMMILPGEQAL